MAVADATADLIRSLDDPTKFKRVERVSVFHPHTRDFPEMRMPDGRVFPAITVSVSDKTLATIAENVNRTYQRDGQLVVLTIGHRKQHPLADETTQPPKVGYARNYRAEQVQRPAGPVLRLTHTEYIDRRFEAEAEKYPARSPEYDPDDQTFGSVALLLRDPALPSGTVHYDAGRGRLLYAMGGEDMSDVWTDDDNKQYAEFCDGVKKYAKSASFLRKYMAEAGITNTAVPALGSAPHMPEYQAVARALLYERVHRRLDALAYEGVQFDRAVELPKLTDELKDDAAREQHLNYMRGHYQKLPVGNFLPVFEGQVGPGGQVATGGPLTEGECHRALLYQTEKSTDWPTAMAYVKAQRLAA